MKPNNVLMLAFALSSALAVSACHRDEADEADHAAVVTAPAASAPVVTAPVVAPAPPVAMADSGLSFADLDKNHDGSITPDELHDSEMLKQHFAKADTNGDGKLSEEEVAKHRADMAATPGG